MGIACLGMGGCNQQQGKTLYVYTNAGFAPYEYINTKGEVVGVDIEIMQEIGRLLGYNVVINDIEFDQILDEVTKNEYAIGAAGMTKDDERDLIAAPSTSYATSVQYVITQKDVLDDAVVGGKVPLSALSNLSIKNIGCQKGTTGSYLVEDAINGTEDDEGQPVTGALEGIDMNSTLYTNAIVASSDIGTALGAVVIDKLPAESIVSSNSNLECYELDAKPESYVLYLNKNATELLTNINEILKVMIDTGYIDYLTVKHSGGINVA